MTHAKRIFIVGHSGAGKGVLAEAIAKKLGWQYLDADFGLAPSIGRSVTEILGKPGEEAFNHCLTQILTHQKTQENIVVTTDDSIVCDEANRQLLSQEFTVFLKVSIDVQLMRISHNRPLLPSNDFKAFLEQLRRERDAFYEQVTKFSLSSDAGGVDEHVEAVVNAFGI